LLDFLAHGIRCIVALNVIHDNVGTRLAKCNRHAPADAGIGACYEGFLASQRSRGRHRMCLLFNEGMDASARVANILQRARMPIGPMARE
jgi:hypothetical protein